MAEPNSKRRRLTELFESVDGNNGNEENESAQPPELVLPDTTLVNVIVKTNTGNEHLFKIYRNSVLRHAPVLAKSIQTFPNSASPTKPNLYLLNLDFPTVPPQAFGLFVRWLLFETFCLSSCLSLTSCAQLWFFGYKYEIAQLQNDIAKYITTFITKPAFFEDVDLHKGLLSFFHEVYKPSEAIWKNGEDDSDNDEVCIRPIRKLALDIAIYTTNFGPTPGDFVDRFPPEMRADFLDLLVVFSRTMSKNTRVDPTEAIKAEPYFVDPEVYIDLDDTIDTV